MRRTLEFVFVWSLAQLLRWLPRRWAQGFGIGLGLGFYRVGEKLRRVGERNLELVYPGISPMRRKLILQGVFISMGRQLAELPRAVYCKRKHAEKLAVYEGLEHFLAAEKKGKGVIFLTAHIGGWEIGALLHSLYGHPLNVVMRALDNPYLDRMTRGFRTAHGNKVIEKKAFARNAIKALKRGETVGVLMDTNMTPPEGAFVDFLGAQACTTTAIARLAMHTGAAVVPGFTYWDAPTGRYVIRFGEALPAIATGDDAADVLANTELYNRVIGDAIRRAPDQWLWVHRRWKTRPEGDTAIY